MTFVSDRIDHKIDLSVIVTSNTNSTDATI
jgi:hypothetical protein